MNNLYVLIMCTFACEYCVYVNVHTYICVYTKYVVMCVSVCMCV